MSFKPGDTDMAIVERTLVDRQLKGNGTIFGGELVDGIVRVAGVVAVRTPYTRSEVEVGERTLGPYLDHGHRVVLSYSSRRPGGCVPDIFGDRSDPGDGNQRQPRSSQIRTGETELVPGDSERGCGHSKAGS